MNQFWEAFSNMFRIPDLRKRIFFTLAVLAVYRFGAFLPTPGVNTDVLAALFATPGILAARRHRERTGEGPLVQVNQRSSLLCALANQSK